MSVIRFGEKTRPSDNTSSYMPAVANLEYPSLTSTTYTRPSDWPTLPAISNHRFHGLVAITNNDEDNYIAFRCQANGGFTVDWGDGITENLANNVTANHKYTYSTLSSNVTSLGYKTAIVQVYPTNTSNTMNLFQFQNHPTIARSHAPRWLEIDVEAPNLSNINICGPFNSIRTPMLEIARIGRNAISNADNLFDSAISLRSVSINTQPFTSFRYTFARCINLEGEGITFEGSSNNILSVEGLFQQAYSIKNAPFFHTNNITDMSLMFWLCQNLETVPAYNTQKVINASLMFTGCSKIKSFPNFNFTNATSLSGMFASCTRLNRAPMLFNTSKVVSMSQMFLNAYSLEYVPCYETSNVTDMSYMFQACYSLKEIPKFNTTKVSNTFNMFNNCVSINSIELDMSNVANANGMFESCNSLSKVSIVNTAKVTDMSNMFSFASALEQISGNFDTANVTNMAFTFFRTRLRTLPSPMNTSKVANMRAFIGNNTDFELMPNLDTANVTNMANMFENCSGLKEIPIMNTSKVTNMVSMFAGTFGLKTIPQLDTANVANMQNFANFSFPNGLVYLPNINTYRVTNFSSFVRNANIVTEIPDYALHNVSTNITLSEGRVWRMKFKGVRVALNISNNFLSANALNEIYTNLAGLGNAALSNANGDGSNITYTTSANHVYIAGQNISVTGFTSPTGYNVTNALILSRTDNTFVVAGATTGTPTGTGTANGGVVNTIITVSNNFGVVSDNTTIATNKGWVVTG